MINIKDIGVPASPTTDSELDSTIHSTPANIRDTQAANPHAELAAAVADQKAADAVARLPRGLREALSSGPEADKADALRQ